MRGVPARSEEAISEATARKEELEKVKVEQEEKLKEVMESLKEETSGLQQDKEVGVETPDKLSVFVKITSTHQPFFILFVSSDQREGADGAQQVRQ